jgi:site-specific DNA-methyltransferase (adenine-specific)
MTQDAAAMSAPSAGSPCVPFKPYYQDDAVTIYNADCRQVLPFLTRFDLLLTDPPYGMNLNTDNSRFSGGTKGNIAKRGNGVGTGRGKRIVGDEKPLGGVPFDFLRDSADDAIIWGMNHFPWALPKGSSLVWIKRNDQAFGTFLSDAEVAWKSDGVGVYCRRDLSNNAIANERVHPTQKPLAIMRWCLEFFPEAATVLDPFMGSGTTLVACKLEGRTAVGIEISEKYCEAAANRLRQGVLF